MFSKSTTGGSGGFSFQGTRIGGSKDSAEVNITMYLVEAETGQVKASYQSCRQIRPKGPFGLSRIGPLAV
ncbi:MAG: hypothetical protein R2861_01605 [Desulfobacterales bacterium]